MSEEKTRAAKFLHSSSLKKLESMASEILVNQELDPRFDSVHK